MAGQKYYLVKTEHDTAIDTIANEIPLIINQIIN